MTDVSSRRVVWWRRTGAPWRDLPEELGPWKTVSNRFDRGSKTGRWSTLFAALATDVDGVAEHRQHHEPRPSAR